MAKLSDTIEEFILSMLSACENSVDFKRNELAQYFNCVPSQINYVLATRFTSDKGYLVESKKGGGGYIRIIKATNTEDNFLMYLLQERIGNSITLNECDGLLYRMAELDLITNRERNIIFSSLKDVPIPMNAQIKDIIRAAVFKNIILSILNEEEGNL